MKTVKINDIISRFLLSGLLVLLCIPFSRAQSIAIPDGYAGYAGTTGGGNATPVTVSTAEEFISAVSNSDPAVIIVVGKISIGTGAVSVGSNKTIVGADSTAGLGGGTIKLDKSNYIIQNLIIGPAGGGDAMEVTGATKVFIHRCDFFDGADGNLDIVRASDYVTVSWCKFYYVNQTSHKNTILLGNSDNATGDEGKLHVTLHHNWFAQGCNSRMPRVRYGHVHIYNNYYSCTGNNYCIGTGYKCHIRVENTYFDNISDPWDDLGGLSSGGVMGWDNLIFVGCSQPTYIPNSYPVFSVPYSYSMDQVGDVKNLVRAGAGNVSGTATGNLPSVSITSPSDNDKFPAGSSITIEANASVTDDTIASVKFYSDTLLYDDTSEPYSFNWDNVGTGIYNLLATTITNGGKSAISRTVTIFSGSGVSISNPVNEAQFEIPTDIRIDAIAWDAGGTVSSVEFFRDTTSLGIDDSPPYSILWNDVIPGIFSLTARASDNDENITISEEVGITVTGGPDGYEFCCKEGDECSHDGLVNIAYGAHEKFNYQYNVTGTVECSDAVFGDPIQGTEKACFVQEVSAPYVVITSPEYGTNYTVPEDITITVYAIDGGAVDSVHYYQNSNLIGYSTTEPFTLTWKGAAFGTHVLTARATDNEGNSSVSAPIIIIVRATGIDKQFAGDVVLYPNPVSGDLILNLGDYYSADAYLTICNSLGDIIMKRTLSGSEHVLDMKALPGGVYFITLTSREGTIVRKIIKN